MPSQPLKILRRPAVESITGLSRSTIYQNMQVGDFPKPIRLGAKAVGWVESEIVDWIEARVSERNSTRY